MKVLVLGAGVIGVTSAWYLARAGAQVTVLDRAAGAAAETSFANAGQISPGIAAPWAAPGIPLKALKWLLQKHAPLAIRADGTLFQWQWLLHMLRHCSARRYAVNKERMMRVAEYSRACLQQLRAETGMSCADYEGRTGGTLQLFRSQQQVEAAARDIAVLKDCGVAWELLAPQDLARVEPALARVRQHLAGGLRLPGDETGDCHLFTRHLAARAQKEGVRFLWNIPVEALEAAGGAIAAVRAGGQRFAADRYVLALGSYSRAMLRPLGVPLPVYPVKGYSLTMPLVDAALAPESTVIDETHKVAITRFAQRIRIGGMAEIAGFDLSLRPPRRATLEMVVRELFPGGDVARASFWTGLRPMTPDGTPLIGPTPWANLFLNTGHGTLGWTMACGAGRLIADMLTGRTPQISTEGLSLARYGASASAGH